MARAVVGQLSILLAKTHGAPLPIHEMDLTALHSESAETSFIISEICKAHGSPIIILAHIGSGKAGQQATDALLK